MHNRVQVGSVGFATYFGGGGQILVGVGQRDVRNPDSVMAITISLVVGKQDV